MGDPNTMQLWNKLNEVSERLQRVSEQLVEATTVNRNYHQVIEQQRAKIDALEEQNHKNIGSISTLKWGISIVLLVAVPSGTWVASSVNQLKQDVAIIKSKGGDS